MKKILIATKTPFSKHTNETIGKIIVNAGYEPVFCEKYSTEGELNDAVKIADALIVRSDQVSSTTIQNAKDLKLIVRAGAGYDNIDLIACASQGITVMNTPGKNANAVAELVFGLLLFHSRNFFDGTTGSELKGKTIGIHGYGFVGKDVARIAHGFGMSVAAYDPFLSNDLIAKNNVKACGSIEELYTDNQFITLHIPLTKETNKFVDMELLRLMPKGATLVNTARKEIINENDLLLMFSHRQDFAYLSDVAPDCAQTIKDQYVKRYFFTPKKLGAQTTEANNNAGFAAAQQVIDFFKRGDVRFKVN